jgi:ADP-heptose:LPS heptosyltransferase
MNSGGTAERILVIKLGALGDIVLALGPFAAIRRDHPDAHITLLTTPAFAGFLGASPYFDEIEAEERVPLWNPCAWLALRRWLREGAFDRVYDLQTSDRSGWYFRLMGPGRRPEWSGIAPGCSHPHANPQRDFMHSIDRQNEQLAMAGIKNIPDADLSWMAADTARFGLAERTALLIPGGAPHRPAKRWPVDCYAELATRLVARGVEPVILGTAAEAGIAREISSACPAARDLTGQTTIEDLAVLARNASGAIGNDTGPMHLIAAAGCPSVVLFSGASDPALTAPRGAEVTVLRAMDLATLSVESVEGALSLR